MEETKVSSILASSNSKAVLVSGIMEASALPGMLVYITSLSADGTPFFGPVNVDEYPRSAAFLLDDQTYGRGILSMYDSGDRVTVAYPPSGEIVHAYLAPSQGVTVGVLLVPSTSAGRLKTYPAALSPNFVVGVSLEDISTGPSEYKMIRIGIF